MISNTISTYNQKYSQNTLKSKDLQLHSKMILMINQAQCMKQNNNNFQNNQNNQMNLMEGCAIGMMLGLLNRQISRVETKQQKLQKMKKSHGSIFQNLYYPIYRFQFVHLCYQNNYPFGKQEMKKYCQSNDVIYNRFKNNKLDMSKVYNYNQYLIDYANEMNQNKQMINPMNNINNNNQMNIQNNVNNNQHNIYQNNTYNHKQFNNQNDTYNQQVINSIYINNNNNNIQNNVNNQITNQQLNNQHNIYQNNVNNNNNFNINQQRNNENYNTHENPFRKGPQQSGIQQDPKNQRQQPVIQQIDPLNKNETQLKPQQIDPLNKNQREQPVIQQIDPLNKNEIQPQPKQIDPLNKNETQPKPKQINPLNYSSNIKTNPPKDPQPINIINIKPNPPIQTKKEKKEIKKDPKKPDQVIKPESKKKTNLKQNNNNDINDPILSTLIHQQNNISPGELEKLQDKESELFTKCSKITKNQNAQFKTKYLDYFQWKNPIFKQYEMEKVQCFSNCSSPEVKSVHWDKIFKYFENKENVSLFVVTTTSMFITFSQQKFPSKEEYNKMSGSIPDPTFFTQILYVEDQKNGKKSFHYKIIKTNKGFDVIPLEEAAQNSKIFGIQQVVEYNWGHVTYKCGGNGKVNIQIEETDNPVFMALIQWKKVEKK